MYDRMPSPDLHSVAQGSGGRRPRRVVIWMNRHLRWLPYLYAPVTDTLLAGFRAAADPLHLVLGFGTKRNDSAAYVGNYSALKRGDVFVWVGMGAAWEMWQTPWVELQRRGVTCILYQTEPHDKCAASTKGPYPVHEIWDFSWHNLEGCARARDAPVARYVPLAALPSPRASPLRPRGVARPLLFFGDPRVNPKREACFKALKGMLGNANVKHTYRNWDDRGFVRVLDRFDLFVNLHKGCGDAHNPVTFRVPKLLNARKLVLSERCHPRDEAEFDQMVLFLDNMTAIGQVYQQLARRGWQERARAAAARFRRHFQPVDIFRRAGIYEALGLNVARAPLPDTE